MSYHWHIWQWHQKKQLYWSVSYLVITFHMLSIEIYIYIYNSNNNMVRLKIAEKYLSIISGPFPENILLAINITFTFLHKNVLWEKIKRTICFLFYIFVASSFLTARKISRNFIMNFLKYYDEHALKLRSCLHSLQDKPFS